MKRSRSYAGKGVSNEVKEHVATQYAKLVQSGSSAREAAHIVSTPNYSPPVRTLNRHKYKLDSDEPIFPPLGGSGRKQKVYSAQLKVLAGFLLASENRTSLATVMLFLYAGFQCNHIQNHC